MADDIDIAVFQDTFGEFDIRFGTDGDFEKTQGFDTAIAISLFGKRRATPAEVPVATRREGWWGNLASLVEDFENGSKLWLLQQERLTNETVNKAKDFVNKSLSWLTEQGFAVNIETDVSVVDGRLLIDVQLERPNGQIEKTGFEFWNNTGE